MTSFVHHERAITATGIAGRGKIGFASIATAPSAASMRREVRSWSGSLSAKQAHGGPVDTCVAAQSPATNRCEEQRYLPGVLGLSGGQTLVRSLRSSDPHHQADSP